MEVVGIKDFSSWVGGVGCRVIVRKKVSFAI